MLTKVTMELSSEYLRLALPYMSRYRVPITPQNYAVWYEYVAGANQPLKAALDTLVKNEQSIDEEITASLYQKYVDPTDLGKIESAQQLLHTLADTLTTSLDTANGEVSRYEKSLKDCATNLQTNIDPDEFKALVQSLEQSTRQMSSGSQQLQQHLADSQREADQLRSELVKTRNEAKKDAMTGLANRKGLEEMVQRLSGENRLGSTCVLICDTDNFKSVNDSYGHLIGDKVIRMVADVLKNQIKGRDTPARFGGEEFIILLPDTELRGARSVAESIRRAVEGCKIVRPRTGEAIRQVTISIGITQCLVKEDFQETVSRADQALYAAKQAGRNRVEVNTPLHEMKVMVC